METYKAAAAAELKQAVDLAHEAVQQTQQAWAGYASLLRSMTTGCDLVCRRRRRNRRRRRRRRRCFRRRRRRRRRCRRRSGRRRQRCRRRRPHPRPGRHMRGAAGYFMPCTAARVLRRKPALAPWVVRRLQPSPFTPYPPPLPPPSGICCSHVAAMQAANAAMERENRQLRVRTRRHCVVLALESR